jgi:hypothetical protein
MALNKNFNKDIMIFKIVGMYVIKLLCSQFSPHFSLYRTEPLFKIWTWQKKKTPYSTLFKWYSKHRFCACDADTLYFLLRQLHWDRKRANRGWRKNCIEISIMIKPWSESISAFKGTQAWDFTTHFCCLILCLGGYRSAVSTFTRFLSIHLAVINSEVGTR